MMADPLDPQIATKIGLDNADDGSQQPEYAVFIVFILKYDFLGFVIV